MSFCHEQGNMNERCASDRSENWICGLREIIVSYTVLASNLREKILLFLHSCYHRVVHERSYLRENAIDLKKLFIYILASSTIP